MKKPPSISPFEIGFDFDCVIADTAGTFLKIVCEEYNYCGYSLEDIHNFNITECLDIPAELVMDIFASLEKDSSPVPPVNGALEVLTKLAQQSRPAIITARQQTGSVRTWLEKNLPASVDIDVFRLIGSGNHDDKLRHIHESSLRCFVDDRAETCKALAGEGIDSIVFDRPWNHSQQDIKRVKNWQEINRLIRWKPEN
jgi:5'(3')-deoxyribonucleotidase